MYTDYRHRSRPRKDFSNNSPFYSYDMDNHSETSDLIELMARRIELQHGLNSIDTDRRSRHYPLIRSRPLARSFRTISTPMLSSRLDSPLTLPPLSNGHYHPSHCQLGHHHDFSRWNFLTREPSFFPLAQTSYHFQTDYDQFFQRKYVSMKRHWKSVAFALIFYFHLKKNLRLAKQMDTYYQRDYRRIRFFELLTAVHRVYLAPKSPIYRALSTAVHCTSIVLHQLTLFQCVQTIIDELTNYLPMGGILGTNSDDSVLIYLLNCSLQQYPLSYFWAIERHLLSLSFSKMREFHRFKLDHFTTKFLLISTFIFRGLVKTLLLKPVKYRLARGQLNRFQWVNTRLLSTLLLYIGRHAIMHKEEQNRLPMPFPHEMKNYLFDDQRIKTTFYNLEKLLESTVPKLSAWACEYAERLQRYSAKRAWDSS